MIVHSIENVFSRNQLDMYEYINSGNEDIVVKPTLHHQILETRADW